MPKLNKTPDKGLRDVHCDDAFRRSPPPVHTKRPVQNKYVRVNFVGRVTPVASAGAFPIARCFGTQFYIEEGTYGSRSSSIFVQAWLMPVLPEKVKGNGLGQGASTGPVEAATLVAGKRKEMFTFEYFKVAQKTEAKVETRTNYLC